MSADFFVSAPSAIFSSVITSIISSNMLGLAKRTKAKFFQASTSEVYGDPAVHPLEPARFLSDALIGKIRQAITMDRAGEAVIYAGIAAGAAMNGRLEVIGLATLALGTGSLVSYVRARGEGLGVTANNGIAQRGERAALLIIGLIVGGAINATWLAGALLLISVLSAITVVQRIRFIRTALDRAESRT